MNVSVLQHATVDGSEHVSVTSSIRSLPVIGLAMCGSEQE